VQQAAEIGQPVAQEARLHLEGQRLHPVERPNHRLLPVDVRRVCSATMPADSRVRPVKQRSRLYSSSRTVAGLIRSGFTTVTPSWNSMKLKPPKVAAY
jgi:hypothetical protein